MFETEWGPPPVTVLVRGEEQRLPPRKVSCLSVPEYTIDAFSSLTDNGGEAGRFQIGAVMDVMVEKKRKLLGLYYMPLVNSPMSVSKKRSLKH